MRDRLRRFAACLAVTACVSAGACGNESLIDPMDDPDTFTVGGTISGQTAAVTLALNGTSQVFDASSFTFSQGVAAGAAYSVLFAGSAGNQQCFVVNGIGIATADVDDVGVTCEDIQPELRFVEAEVTGNLAVGDFDGDGIQDVVVTIRTLPGHAIASNLDMYRILFGTGGAAYSAPLDVARIGSSDTDERGRHFVVDDFDGDGVDDFAYSGGYGLEVFTLGAGRTPQRIFAPGPNGIPLVEIDANGDGSPDLVSIIWGGSNLNYFNIYRGIGGGSFAAEEFIGNRDDPEAQTLGMGSPVNMVVGDVDGDGNDDIVAVVLVGFGVDQSLALGVFYGDGLGGFDYPSALDPITDDVFEGYFPFEIASKELAAGDIDGDGDLDLAMTSTTNFVLLLDNDGSGSFSESGRVPVRLRPIHTRLADFDDDGVLDLLAAHGDSRDVIIAFGLGGGTFGSAAGSDAEWLEFALPQNADLYDVTVVDIDGDGLLDVAVAENGTNPSDSGRGSVQLWLSPGG